MSCDLTVEPVHPVTTEGVIIASKKMKNGKLTSPPFVNFNEIWKMLGDADAEFLAIFNAK